MLYRIIDNQTIPTISGRNIAHGHRTAAERGLLSGDVHLGRISPVKLTVKQCATLCGVSVPYTAAAVLIADDPAARAAVLAGEQTLLDAAKKITPETLAEDFKRASRIERLEAAHALGPTILWDEMIAPLV
jgi:hypothetical protein